MYFLQTFHKLSTMLNSNRIWQVLHHDANLLLNNKSVYQLNNMSCRLQMLQNHELSKGIELDAVTVIELVLFTDFNSDQSTL